MALVDKDKPWTWKSYKNGMCDGCYGSCCTMPVEVHGEDLVRLGVLSQDDLDRSIKKAAKKLIKEGWVRTFRSETELFQLQSRPNGDCIFLDTKTRLCTRYEKRPGVCREFPKIGPRPGFCPVVPK